MCTNFFNKICNFFAGGKPSQKNKLLVVNIDGSEKNVKKIKGLKVSFLSTGATVKIYKPFPRFIGCKIFCGKDAVVSIKSSKHDIKRLFIHATAKNSQCLIDEDFSVKKDCKLIVTKETNKKISIGKDCMFATNVLIRTTDAHTIIDQKNKEVINYAQDITIGDNVWLAYGVTVLKGANIASGSIVGAESVVTKSCDEPNAIYAGVPAKKIRSNIKWYRDTVEEYLEKHAN